MSPIEPSTSSTAAAAPSGETLDGGSWRVAAKGAFAGIRITTVLHPAVRLALADGAGIQQHLDCPALQRPDRGPPLLHHQHREASCAKKDTASPASPIRNVEPRICTASSGYQNGVHLVPNALYRLDNTVEPTVRAEHCWQETQEEAARVVFTGYLTQEAVCVLRKPMSRAGQSGKDNTCKCLHTRSIVTCLLFPRGAAVGTRSGQGLGVEADDGCCSGYLWY